MSANLLLSHKGERLPVDLLQAIHAASFF